MSSSLPLLLLLLSYHAENRLTRVRTQEISPGRAGGDLYVYRLILRHKGIRFVHGVHMLQHSHHHVAVTPLVVIPGDELHKVLIQRNTRCLIKMQGQGLPIRSVDTTWSRV